MEPNSNDHGSDASVVSNASAGQAATRWIGWALVAGLALTIPAGVLLGYLAALPFFLGLFFFMLVGLLIGAVMFRVAAKAPRPPVGAIWLLGSVVSGATLVVSLWAEYRALPAGVEKLVRGSIAESFAGREDERVRLKHGVHEFVATELARAYPPGGFLGYLRWAATDGKLKCPRILRTSTVEYRLAQRQVLWAVRVALSMLLMEAMIVSQLLALRGRKADTADGAGPGLSEESPN
ncbi:MAG TPA: hypothetical protein PL151_07235 [Phycisphaerae bacterium]|nr:hypothetical protein [Phycisphaerae bacterium]